MRSATVLLALLLAAGTAQAIGPDYQDDPFGDADFDESELILDPAYPARGRLAVSLLFASSVIDKYSSHTGGLLQVEYSFTDSLGAMLSIGFLHGQLTHIVTDDAGIIGHKVKECISNANACADINPQVPDYRQMTGTVNAALVWSPLYGKINVVSELDANLQAYLLVGGGVVGTREVEATVSGTPARASDYSLSGQDLGDGGLLSDAKINGTVGVGMQVFVAELVALRGEVRGIVFRDEFDFESGSRTGPNRQGYVSQHWFFHIGLAFNLFS